MPTPPNAQKLARDARQLSLGQLETAATHLVSMEHGLDVAGAMVLKAVIAELARRIKCGAKLSLDIGDAVSRRELCKMIRESFQRSA